MIPLALSGILCFANVPFEGIALHAWVAFAYVFYGMSYTGTSMPFGAMASVVSTDPIDRSKLSRARSIGGTVVGIGALSVVPILCFDKDSNIIPERFGLIAVIFGILCVISYLLLCNLTIERVRQPKQKGEKFNYGNVLKAAVKNRPLIGVMVATIGSMLYITGSGQLKSYIYKEFYQDTSLMTLASIGTLPVMIICFILVPKIVQKFGKRNVILVMSTYNLLLSTYILLFPIQSALLYTILNLLATIGQTAFTILIWALVTDCLDYSEWKMNFRADGSMYSSIRSAVRLVLPCFYRRCIRTGCDRLRFRRRRVQSAATINNIYYLVNAVPVITCILELIGIGLIFNLNQKKTAEMYAALAERRNSQN